MRRVSPSVWVVFAAYKQQLSPSGLGSRLHYGQGRYDRCARVHQVRPQRPCRHHWKYPNRLADASVPVLRNRVTGRHRYGHRNVIRAFKVFRVPIAVVEPRGRRSSKVLDRLCDGLRGVLDGSRFH